MKNQLLIFLLFFVFSSCGYKNQKKDEKSELSNNISKETYYDKEVRETFKKIREALNVNDTITYNECAAFLELHHFKEDLFFYALQMANKNNYPEAYFHVYTSIAYSTPKDAKEALALMSKKTRNMAIYHLLKSFEMGYDRAKYLIEDILGKEGLFISSDVYFKEWMKQYSQ